MNKPIIKTSAAGVALQPLPPSVSPLTAENLLWANTVLAAGSAVGFVIYTGSETRAVMNTSHPETKVGLLDLEINNLSKVSLLLSRFGLCLTKCSQILCAVTFALSLLLVALNGFRGQWYVYVFRFLILFSSIIPIRWVFRACLVLTGFADISAFKVCVSTWTWARRFMDTRS